MARTMRFILPVIAVLFVAACGGRTETPAPAPATEVAVRFLTPADGDTLSNPVALSMEVVGLTLQPAGVMAEGSGHLHVLVDTLFVDPGQVIPKNEHHIHYGDGSTQAELTLAPGEHTLKLQFADGAHVALEGGQYRDEIRIVVR